MGKLSYVSFFKRDLSIVQSLELNENYKAVTAPGIPDEYTPDAIITGHKRMKQCLYREGK
jgi:hypothetical protein